MREDPYKNKSRSLALELRVAQLSLICHHYSWRAVLGLDDGL